MATRLSAERALPLKKTAAQRAAGKTPDDAAPDAAAETAASKTAPAKVARKAAVKTAPKAAATTAAPKGLSLHIGLNSVSPKHYGGWTGDLTACEFDAQDMAALVTAKGIKPTVLLTKQATRAKVLTALKKAAATLKAGDLFVLSYSGHGGQVDDIDHEEDDGQDETWCLYDAQLIDDELYFALSRFAAGVRILVLSDSCHSGTVTREVPRLGAAAATPAGAARARLLPPTLARRIYREHKAYYDGLQRAVAKEAGGAVADPDAALAALGPGSSRVSTVVASFEPALILISGCQDNQTSMDGEHNGAYTERLLAVWNGGRFKGNYRSFHKRILAGMDASQSPNLFTLGPAAAFLKQAPFTV